MMMMMIQERSECERTIVPDMAWQNKRLIYRCMLVLVIVKVNVILAAQYYAVVWYAVLANVE